MIHKEFFSSLGVRPAFFRYSLYMLFAISLGACGGGEGSGSVAELTAADIKGRWEASSVIPARVVYVLPASSSRSAVGWLLAADGFSMEHWSVSTSGESDLSVTAKKYALGVDASPGQFTSVGTAGFGTAATLNINKAGYVRSDLLDGSLVLNDIQGDWSASAGNGDVKLDLRISALGKLTGTTTTGCEYDGNVATVDGVAVLDLSLTETCADSIRQFAGIAAFRTGGTPIRKSLTLMLKTISGADRALVVRAEPN